MKTESKPVEETEEYLRIRVKDPGLFDKDSFRTVWLSESKGINSVQGKLKGETTMTVQSLLFVKEKWSEADALAWAREHDFIKTYEPLIEPFYLPVAFYKSGISIKDQGSEKKQSAGFKFEAKGIDRESRTITGYVSTKDLDDYRDIVYPSAFKKHLDRFKENPIVCFMHNWKQAIGKALDLQIKDHGLWSRIFISETAKDIWTLIDEGVLKAFSFAWDWENPETDVEMIDGIRHIKNLILLEISVVTIPANPRALFDLAKKRNLPQIKTLLKEVDSDVKDKKSDDDDLKLRDKNQKVEVKQMGHENEFTADDRKHIQEALKLIKQVQEKQQNVDGFVSKADLDSFKENIKGDLSQALEKAQKAGRKMQFAAQIDTDPNLDAGIDHPRIWKAKKPEEKFGNLLTISTRDPKIKRLQKAADDLLLTHIFLKKFSPDYAGIKTLALYQRWMAISEEYRKAMDTATAGEGLEWIPTGLSADIIEKVRLELKVAALFDRFTMPTSPFKYPLLTAGATVYYVPEALTDIADKIPKSNVTSSDLTFTARKLACSIVASEELNEDAVIAVLPVLKADLARAMAEAQEDVIINGDRSATHLDSDVTSSLDRRKAWTGLRKHVQDADDYDCGTYSAANVRNTRALMDEYGVDPSKLAHVVSISAYMKMLSFTEVATVDKFGEQATWLKGFLSALDGSPIIVSEKVRMDLNATGDYDGTTTDNTIHLIVNHRCFLIGDRRLITIKTAEKIETDQEILVVTQRMDFQKKYAAAEDCVAEGFNIPVP